MPVFKPRTPREINEKKLLRRIKRLYKGMWQARDIKKLVYNPTRQVVTVYLNNGFAPFNINVRDKNDVQFVDTIVNRLCLHMY